jgi:hypothetical protein
MSVIPMDNAHMVLTLDNDTQQMRTFIDWLEERNISYQANMTATNLTAASITGTDQTAVLAFVADVARMFAYVTGTPQTIAGNVKTDIANIRGVA